MALKYNIAWYGDFMNTLSNLLLNNFLGIFLNGLLKPQEYLDPGTGSFIIQIIISSIVGLLYLLRVYWGKIVGIFKKNDASAESEIIEDEQEQA